MHPKPNHHELVGQRERVEASSDRSFGQVFATFFAILAAWNGWRGGVLWPLYAAVGLIFLALAVWRPGCLGPLNRLWSGFGLLLGRIVTPVILAGMFFLVFTPIGWAVRMSGRDLLRLKRSAESRSYWIAREPPGPQPDSLHEQF